MASDNKTNDLLPSKRSLTRKLCAESIWISIEDLNFNYLGKAEILDFTVKGLRLKTKIPLREFETYRFCAPKKLANPFFCLVCWTKQVGDHYQLGARLVPENAIPIYDIIGVKRTEHRRKLNRIPLTADRTLKVILNYPNGSNVETPIIDYHCLAVAIKVPHDTPKIQSAKGYSIVYGNIPLICSNSIKVIRQEPNNIAVIDLEKKLSHPIEHISHFVFRF